MLAAKIGYFRTTTHPEASDWAARVVTNGGSVSASTLSAVSTFCYAIDTAGIRSKILRFNPFAGTGLSACLVPLYRGASLSGTQYGNTTDSNANFVSGDYTETGTNGGLLGNGTSKSLNTGFRTQDFSDMYSVHIGVWTRGGTTVDTRRVIGCFGASNDNYFLDVRLASGGGNTARLGAAYQIGPAETDGSAQSLIGSRRSASSMSLYKNGSSVVSGTTTISGVTGTTQVLGVFTGLFSGTSGGAWYQYRLAGYTIGGGMTDSQVSSLHTAWSTLQTALSRGL